MQFDANTQLENFNKASRLTDDGHSQKQTVVQSPKVIAFILAYNCERMLNKAYNKIPKELVDEIIISNDGSKDKTAEVAAGIGVKVFTNTPNRGYGGNLKASLKNAFALGADYAVEIHGDGAQFDPIAIRDALPLMSQGYDLILGSRFQKPMLALKNGMPLIRFVANRFLSFFDRLVLKLPLTEFHTGFRIYSRRLYETIPLDQNAENYLFSFEIIAQAAYYNLKVGEVPVEADYISEHTSHKVSGAAVYAVQTFGILGQFISARMGWAYSQRFPKLNPKKNEELFT